MNTSASMLRILLAALCIMSANAAICFALDKANARRMLAQRLDSLEMVFQQTRRKGEPVASLDSEMLAVRDSLVIARKQLSNHATLPTDTMKPNQKENLRGNGLWPHWAMPATMVDWAIIIIGGVAVLSGLVLLFTLLHAWLFRTPRRVKTGGLAPTASEKFGLHPRNTASDQNIAALPASDADQEAAMFKEIRRCAGQAPPHKPSVIPQKPAPAEPEEKRFPTSMVSSEELRSAVCREAAQGLTALQISKKLHISVDQAELMLRLARKKPATDSDT